MSIERRQKVKILASGGEEKFRLCRAHTRQLRSLVGWWATAVGGGQWAGSKTCMYYTRSKRTDAQHFFFFFLPFLSFLFFPFFFPFFFSSFFSGAQIDAAGYLCTLGFAAVQVYAMCMDSTPRD